jgi:hypothetical protein
LRCRRKRTRHAADRRRHRPGFGERDVEREIRALRARGARSVRRWCSPTAALRSRPAAPAFTLRFQDAQAQWRTALFRHIGLLDAFFRGELDVDGDLRALMRAGMSGASGVPIRW